MKIFQNTFLIGLIAFATSSVWAADSDAAKNDLATLQGEWSLVSGSSDGIPMPDELQKGLKRVCKGDETTTTMGGQVIIKANITLDPSKKPKTIDYKVTDGYNKGKTQLGVYELEGDTFKTFFSAPGEPRPADFITASGDHRTLTLWKHEKAAVPPAVPPEKK